MASSAPTSTKLETTARFRKNETANIGLFELGAHLHHPLLRILDIPHNDSKEPIKDALPGQSDQDQQMNALAGIDVRLAEILGHIPEQPGSTIRVFITQDLSEIGAFSHYINSITENDSGDSPHEQLDELRGCGYKELLAQWTSKVPRPSCTSTVYHATIYDVTELRSELKTISYSVEVARGFIQTSTLVRIVEVKQGGLVLLVSSKSTGTQHSVKSTPNFLDRSVEKYAEDLIASQKYYRLLLQDAPEGSHWKVILLLWHYHVQLLQLDEFLTTLREIYLPARIAQLNLASTQGSRKSSLGHMLDDALLYQEIDGLVKEHVVVIEALRGILEAAMADSEPPVARISKSLAADLQMLCNTVGYTSNYLLSNIDQQIRVLELKQRGKDSDVLWTLTVLASIFLPLSLATGALSMQTRFADLGYLLFDWAGVVILLITLAAWVLLHIFVWRLLAQRRRLTQKTYSDSERRRTLVISWTRVLFLSVVVIGWVLGLMLVLNNMLPNVDWVYPSFFIGVGVIGGISVVFAAAAFFFS